MLHAHPPINTEQTKDNREIRFVTAANASKVASPFILNEAPDSLVSHRDMIANILLIVYFIIFSTTTYYNW
jgi:hypothetical protein